MMYARDRGILQSQITAAVRSLRLRGVRQITADHLRVELDAMLDASEGRDDVLPAPVDSPDTLSGQQCSSIEEHALSTLDALTVAMSGLTAHRICNNLN